MPSSVEFIIVNNGSIDHTDQVVNEFINLLPNLRLINESTVGLSYSRNCGAMVAIYDWVCYVDDDAKAHHDFLEQFLFTKNNFSFDGFGGMFYPWYRTPGPQWIPKEVVQFRMLRDTPGALLTGQTVAGGICAFKKKILIECGLFPVEIGMRGNIIGYGEENALQSKIWEYGGVIGFNPNWKIDHLVAEYKYRISWHLKRNYGKGRDMTISDQISYSFLKKTWLFFRVIFVPFYLVIRKFPRFISSNKYYWQNYFLDSFSHSAKCLGIIFSKVKHNE